MIVVVSIMINGGYDILQGEEMSQEGEKDNIVMDKIHYQVWQNILIVAEELNEDQKNRYPPIFHTSRNKRQVARSGNNPDI